MASNTAYRPRVSFSRLNRVLEGLGFVRRRTADFIAYREEAHDATILLPVMRGNATVSDAHLVTASNTIVGKGVATSGRVYELLCSSGPSKLFAATADDSVGQRTEQTDTNGTGMQCEAARPVRAHNRATNQTQHAKLKTVSYDAAELPRAQR
jgi:hypothetical protein